MKRGAQMECLRCLGPRSVVGEVEYCRLDQISYNQFPLVSAEQKYLTVCWRPLFDHKMQKKKYC